MLKTLCLASLLLAGLALPAFAQTPQTGANRNTAHPPPGTAAPTTGATSRAPAASTSATPAPTTATPSARGGTAPSATAPAATAALAPGGGKIDINSASPQQLDTLPGVGPALAQQIVTGRPWDDLNDLVKKKALPQGVFDRNKDRFALANINSSSAADMAKTLPGIGEVRSRAIVSGRPYQSPQDLVAKHVLTQAQFDKIKELVAY